MRKHLLVSLSIAWIVAAPASAQYYEHPTGSNSVQALSYNGGSVELLQDRSFANGFRAFWTAKTFDKTVDPSLKLGNIESNHTPYINSLYGWGYVVHNWGPAPQGDVICMPFDRDKFWNFNEGLHEDYYDDWGQYYPSRVDANGNTVYDANGNKVWGAATDLAVHRIEVNAECTGCTSSNPDFLLLNSFNQYPTHSSTHELVRTAYTNRNGGLYTYMNTANEIRNEARNNNPIYALDTWPHFILEQNLKRLVDLATVETVRLTAKFRVWSIPGLTPLPNGYADAIYGVGFGLRRKDNPYAIIFLGYHLYAVGVDLNWAYGANPGVDQWGQSYFNGNTISDLGGPLVPNDSDAIFSGGTTKTIDLRALFNEAVSQGASFGSFEDYYLSGVGVGWETLGQEEVRSQISDVSLSAETSPLFDSEVFQDSYAATQYNWWSGGGAAGMTRAHWVKWGIDEGRHASPTFWPDVYRSRYANEIAAMYGTATNRNAILHYVAVGRAQGKSGAP